MSKIICKGRRKDGTPCTYKARKQGLCGHCWRWENNGHDPYGGVRADARKHLGDYVDCLKKGMGRRSAAATAHVCYDTVMKQRDRNPAFAALELASEHGALGEVEDALFENAKTGNVGAVALYLKYRWGWSDVSRVEITERVRQTEFNRVLQALEAAGVTDEQLAAAQELLEIEDAAGTVH